MSKELLGSKVVVFEQEPKVRGIGTVPTSMTGALGVTERGPVDRAVLCTSFDDYDATFGAFTATADVALAAKGFFENGGTHLWVARVASGSASTASLNVGGVTEDEPTAGAVRTTGAMPFAVENGQVLHFDVLTPSGTQPLDVGFLGGSAELEANFDIAYVNEGDTLILRVDWGPPQTVTFTASQFADITAPTLDEVFAVITAAVPGVEFFQGDSIYMSTVSQGRASMLQVVGGTADLPFGRGDALATGTGNVENMNAITAADLRAIIADEVENDGAPGVQVVDLGTAFEFRTTGTGSSWGITASGSAASVFGLDATLHSGTPGVQEAVFGRFEALGPGASGNGITIQIVAASNEDARQFDVVVRYSDGREERFSNLSRDKNNSRYYPAVINHPVNGSKLVRAFDYEDVSTGTPLSVAPTNALSGGDDGGPIDDTDYAGTAQPTTGLHAFDEVQDLSILIAPGRATPSTHQNLLAYCENDKGGLAFAVLDPPAGMNATDIVEYVSADASLEGLSEHGAIYWPRVKVLNPSRSVFGSVDQITVPPSGIIAGVYARTDASSPGGVYVPPAGVESGRMFGVLGFETNEALKDRRRDIVYPHRINPLTTEPGLPKYIDGSRTLKGNGNFSFVAERRGVSFIERSLKQGLQFARHENNTPELRSQVRRTIMAFLLTQMRNGAFQTQDPSTAFYVDVSDELNPPSAVAAGKLNIRVGLATNKPAEYVVLEISQDTRALEEELAV